MFLTNFWTCLCYWVSFHCFFYKTIVYFQFYVSQFTRQITVPNQINQHWCCACAWLRLCRTHDLGYGTVYLYWYLEPSVTPLSYPRAHIIIVVNGQILNLKCSHLITLDHCCKWPNLITLVAWQVLGEQKLLGVSIILFLLICLLFAEIFLMSIPSVLFVFIE